MSEDPQRGAPPQPEPPANPPASRAPQSSSTGEGAAGAPPRHRERRTRAVGWQSRDVLRASALVVGFWLALRLLWFANQIVFICFLGILFGLAVSAGVDRLQRFRIPRGIGAALIVFGFVGSLALFVTLTAPVLRRQALELRDRLPQAVDKVENWLNARRQGMFGILLGGTEVARGPQARSPGGAARPAAHTDTLTPGDTTRRAGSAPGKVPDTLVVVAQAPPAVTAAEGAARGGATPSDGLRTRIGQQFSSVRRYLFPFLSSTIAVVGGILLMLVLTIYIAAEPDLYHRGLMHLFPHRARPRAGEVLHQTAFVLRKWFIAQLIGMAAIGIVTTIALLLLKVKAAVALGIIAGLLEFIPTVGPIIAAVPAIAMGFLDSPQKALWVALACIAIQQLENHILIPQLMKQHLDLAPALTVIAQAVMALVFGFLGLLVAVPMLAAVMVPIKLLYVEGVVGDDMDAGGEEDD